MTTEFLVSTDWLADRLDVPSIRVLDVSGFLDDDGTNLAHPQYLEGHVPGAVWFDVASYRGRLSDPDAALPWTWPSLGFIEEAMGATGVGPDTTVVITARTFEQRLGLGTMWCTRAWWTLHHSGVRCVILEGGLERWQREGRRIETGEVAVAPATFSGVDRRAEAIADRHDVLEALDATSSCVIDALPPESFSGERATYGRPGHITGAQNVPYARLIVEPTASFVSEDEARTVFAEAGLLDRERAVLY